MGLWTCLKAILPCSGKSKKRKAGLRPFPPGIATNPCLNGPFTKWLSGQNSHLYQRLEKMRFFTIARAVGKQRV